METELNFEKVWQLFQETDRMFQETDKKMKTLQELFEGQWGKLDRGGEDHPAGQAGRKVHRAPPSRQALPARIRYPIRATGNSATIVNPAGFEPRKFG